MTKQYNLDLARTETQKNQMKDLAARGICAFCAEHIFNEHREPIEIETEHWFATKNDYPYEGTKLHLLMIPKEHVRAFSDLSVNARQDFTDTLVKIEKKWHLDSYALGMRSGDMRFNGATVEHLHCHIVVGDVDNPEHQPVRFKMSSRPK